MTSVVYFLQVQPDGPIKIGCTKGNVYLRVTALQQASPYELKWIGYFPGCRADEKAAHHHCAPWRLRNEWFHPTPGVIAFVRSKCPEFCPVKARDEMFLEPERQEVLRALAPERYSREEHKRRDKISSMSRMGLYEMWGWLLRERMPKRSRALRAAEAARKILRIGALEAAE